MANPGFDPKVLSEAVELVKRWEDSKGARAELALATALGHTIVALNVSGEIIHQEHAAAVR